MAPTIEGHIQTDRAPDLIQSLRSVHHVEVGEKEERGGKGTKPCTNTLMAAVIVSREASKLNVKQRTAFKAFEK